MSDLTLQVVRYANRKLYCRETSGYITMRELIDEVQCGRSVSVIDNITKNDLTREILSRCVAQMNIPTEQIVSLIRGVQ